MAIYVDDMMAGYGRMKMCHMVADTTEELLAMADRIGVRRKWLQKPGTPQEHFDICLAKRAAAVSAGAIEVTTWDVGKIVRQKRAALRPNAELSRTAERCRP